MEGVGGECEGVRSWKLGTMDGSWAIMAISSARFEKPRARLTQEEKAARAKGRFFDPGGIRDLDQESGRQAIKDERRQRWVGRGPQLTRVVKDIEKVKTATAGNAKLRTKNGFENKFALWPEEEIAR